MQLDFMNAGKYCIYSILSLSLSFALDLLTLHFVTAAVDPLPLSHYHHHHSPPHSVHHHHLLKSHTYSSAQCSGWFTPTEKLFIHDEKTALHSLALGISEHRTSEDKIIVIRLVMSKHCTIIIYTPTERHSLRSSIAYS